jgi:hypothetical protein
MTSTQWNHNAKAAKSFTSPPPIAPKWNATAKTINVIAAVKRCMLMSVRLNPPLASQNNGAPIAIAMVTLLKISRYLMSV